MPPRVTNIPHVVERSALQKLIALGPLAPLSLHPAGERTLNKMMQKSWLAMDGKHYKITEAGLMAFRTKFRRSDDSQVDVHTRRLSR